MIKNYIKLDSCTNCVFAIKYGEQDDSEYIYCNFDDTFEGWMYGQFSYSTKNGKQKSSKKFYSDRKWADSHRVDYCGKCDEWKLEANPS